MEPLGIDPDEAGKRQLLRSVVQEALREYPDNEDLWAGELLVTE
ncbi:MAG: hypothetical protein R3F14_11705 [Polyangiaceae bacterium]